VIFFFDKSILPKSVAFVTPHSSNSKSVTLVNIRSSQEHVLDDLSEISQVELIMELSSSGHELRLGSHLHEHIHSGINDPWSHITNLFLESVEMVLEDLEIDLGKYFSLGSQTGNKSQVS
jgi:hypothetical protein